MTIKIASWNIEGRLTAYAHGKRGTPEHILQGIAALNADILVLPEAYLEQPAEGVDDRLRELGYEWCDASYGNDRDWSLEFMAKMPYLRVLSRLAITSVEHVVWGGRTMLVATVIEPESQKELRIIATHLDDRSEAKRLAQVRSIAPFVAKTSMPTVMLGDFNAMWHEGRARFIGSRAMRFIARHLPGEMLRDVAVRFTDMATGSVLKELSEKTGLRDADPQHTPTTTPKMRVGLGFMPSLPLAQIDHMMVSKGVRAEKYAVSADGGSDHRAISAIIHLA